MKDVSVLGLHSPMQQRWSGERGAGRGACDFKALMIPVLISLEDAQSLNLCVLTSATMPMKL